MCVSVCWTGGRLSRSDGEGLSSVDLPSQPPLSVEETGPAQAETSGLVSVSLCLCVCVTVVQYVPLFLLTSQCVTDVSSSAASLDAMERYFLSSLPSHVDLNITLDVLPLTIQFYFSTDSSVKVMSHIYCIQNTYILIVFLLAYVLNDRQMTEH